MSSGDHIRPQIPTVGPSLVMVCDDDADTRAVVSHSLVALDHKIVEAEDGGRAIEYCKSRLPDLIISDIMMPNVNGIEFVKWVREEVRDQYVPILMLTALSGVEHRVEGLQIGADDYLTKPFNYRELQARVQALLRIKILTENLYRRQLELEELNSELSQMQDELVRKERELVAAQMAGAAAHNIGQPVTSILLNCRLIEKGLQASENETQVVSAGQALKALGAIQKECEAIRAMIDKLKVADANQTEDYVGEMSIIDIER